MFCYINEGQSIINDTNCPKKAADKKSPVLWPFKKQISRGKVEKQLVFIVD